MYHHGLLGTAHMCISKHAGCHAPKTTTLIFQPYLRVSCLTWCTKELCYSVRVQVSPCLRVVFCCNLFGFPLLWTTARLFVCRAMDRLILWTNLSRVVGKYIFYDVVCRFCLVLAFLVQICYKYGERMVHMDSPHSKPL